MISQNNCQTTVLAVEHLPLVVRGLCLSLVCLARRDMTLGLHGWKQNLPVWKSLLNEETHGDSSFTSSSNDVN